MSDLGDRLRVLATDVDDRITLFQNENEALSEDNIELEVENDALKVQNNELRHENLTIQFRSKGEPS